MDLKLLEQSFLGICSLDFLLSSLEVETFLKVECCPFPVGVGGRERPMPLLEQLILLLLALLVLLDDWLLPSLANKDDDDWLLLLPLMIYIPIYLIIWQLIARDRNLFSNQM